ncbi:MAG: bifunctional 4-hydroxy-2-oxoglutarate aldolase/2-dehydro-3-deoxy-phosphogluconate aldolase [Propionibacteriaceae bacterium]|jgi:2-dehydro-3-deoxyphosphogluconate aldolase/(4S)-4-hydroxy-2-oxoglutarate aldolase|nr:bifunctional 4-hydroxy-2-oxoglutarate aldolase/2-dehydro-3-deoxy-phosphogluconate aldolase [Propionibacteriaceae bacterium]
MDLFAHKIIPVVIIHDTADAEPLAQALIAGGLPIAEVTFRTAAAAESIEIMSEIDGITVGAGTVLTPEQVEIATEAGAQFFVSPGLRPDVVREAQVSGRPILPGAVTPGEIMQAQSMSIETVKFFPANLYGGAAGIKALAAPFTTMKFVPTGGVSPQNLDEYLSLPYVPAVGGSWMVPATLIDDRRFDEITALCRQAAELAAPYRAADDGDAA